MSRFILPRKWRTISEMCKTKVAFNLLTFRLHCAVFCPGLKKGTLLLEGKGHFCARNYILRELLRAELHFEGTFVRGIAKAEIFF